MQPVGFGSFVNLSYRFLIVRFRIVQQVGRTIHRSAPSRADNHLTLFQYRETLSEMFLDGMKPKQIMFQELEIGLLY